MFPCRVGEIHYLCYRFPSSSPIHMGDQWDQCVSFVEILVSINGNMLTTSVFYKPTDSHCSCIHPFIPAMLRGPCLSLSFFVFAAFAVRMRISSPNVWKIKHFFVERGYPSALIDAALSKVTHISRLDTLGDTVSNTLRRNTTPLVLTHHPFNFSVGDAILKNFHILQIFFW